MSHSDAPRWNPIAPVNIAGWRGHAFAVAAVAVAAGVEICLQHLLGGYAPYLLSISAIIACKFAMTFRSNRSKCITRGLASARDKSPSAPCAECNRSSRALWKSMTSDRFVDHPRVGFSFQSKGASWVRVCNSPCLKQAERKKPSRSAANIRGLVFVNASSWS